MLLTGSAAKVVKYSKHDLMRFLTSRCATWGLLASSEERGSSVFLFCLQLSEVPWVWLLWIIPCAVCADILVGLQREVPKAKERSYTLKYRCPLLSRRYTRP